jgi:hypothetical protein
MNQYVCRITRDNPSGGTVGRGTLTLAAEDADMAKANADQIVADLEQASGARHYCEWLDKGGNSSPVPVEI